MKLKIMHLFLSNMQLFSYLWIILMFLSAVCFYSHSDGTHPLQRIHWWATDVMLNSDEETIHISSWMAWGWVNFHILMNYCFNTENTMHTWCTNAWNQARRIYVHIEYVLGHTHLHVYNYYAIWHYGVSIKHCISNVTQGLPRWNLKLFPLKIPVCLARSKFI